MKRCIINSSIFIFFCFLTNPSYPHSPNWAWAKTAGESLTDQTRGVFGNSVGVDLSGDSYVTGMFTDTIYFGPYSLTAMGVEIYLVKYDAGGNVLWAKNAGGPGNVFKVSLAVDYSGNVYVAGDSAGPYLIFGTDTVWNEVELNAFAFVVKYDVGGNVLWGRSGWGTPDESGPLFLDMSGIVVDSSGNSYVTGGFGSSTLTFGSHVLTNAGGFDLFLVKYDANGNVLWAKSIGGTKDERDYSVATDNTGSPCVTGYFSSDNLIVGSDTLKIQDSTGANTLLVKYNTNGNALWAKNAGGNLNDYSASVAVDRSGNIFTTGSFSSPTLIFGSDTLTNIGNNIKYEYFDMFLAKANSTLGVLELRNSPGLLIYPNPATDRIAIEIPVEKTGSIISVVDIEGQQVLQQKITKPTMTIDSALYTAGFTWLNWSGRRVSGQESSSRTKKFKFIHS